MYIYISKCKRKTHTMHYKDLLESIAREGYCIQV